MSLRRRGAAAGVAATLGAENTSGRAGPRKNQTAAFDPNEPISGLRQKKESEARGLSHSSPANGLANPPTAPPFSQTPHLPRYTNPFSRRLTPFSLGAAMPPRPD